MKLQKIILLLMSLCLILTSAQAAEEHTAQAIPWSGYWWPFNYGGLATGFDYWGNPAPLEKYELLTTGMSWGPSVSWYKENFYSPEAPGWYGLCGEWAEAAVYEEYEIYPSSEDNIIFRVGDKKGLLTLAHTDDIAERADGSDPATFHYWLLHYIRDQGQAFVADLDPSEEVWSYPVYKYHMETEISQGRESVFVTIYYADDNVHPDYIGTQERWQTYTYDLFIGEDGEITGGEWTGFSVSDHPQRVFIPLLVRGRCPYLDYEIVVELAQSKDDDLENEENLISIGPGTYNLVLMDEDTYRIDCLNGETVSIQIDKQPGSYEAIQVVLTDADGEVIQDIFVDNEHHQFKQIFIAENPPYTLSLTQNNGLKDPNIYTLTLDLLRIFQQRIPYIPKHGGMWSGFALTNPNTFGVHITLSTYTAQGIPVQTVLGPLEMFPGEKRLFYFDDLPWRQHELPDTDALYLMADEDIVLLNLFGNPNDSLACFVQNEFYGSHLIIPDTAGAMSSGKRMFGNITNMRFEETSVLLRLYSGDGILQTERTESIGARGNFLISPGDYPFYNMPVGGWLEIIGSSDAMLSGFQYLSSAGKSAESVFAMPVRDSEKFVPHIPPPGEWITTVTLINPSDEDNTLVFHLKLAEEDSENDLSITLYPGEKQSFEIQEQFGKSEKDDLYRSVLEIKGEYPFVGYFSYRTIEDRDEASFPLSDRADLKTELVLPHYAGKHHGWWTGFSVFNPMAFEQAVMVEPYDFEGRLMAEHIKYLILRPGAYEALLVSSLYPEIHADISFMMFKPENPRGFIGGFYLYGSMKKDVSASALLSGANM